MFPGVGTLVNVVAVLVGTAIGALAGDRLPPRTHAVVTDGLGLVTLVIAGSSVVAVTDPALSAAVGSSAPLLIVLGAVLLGGIAGSAVRIEDRLESLGGAVQRRLARSAERPLGKHLPPTGAAPATGAAVAAEERRARFVQGFVVASLVFCVGPLTILGSIEEGLGNGPDQLLLKSALDGFAAIAFAAAFGWGVAASVLALVTVQGGLTVLGVVLGEFVPDAHLAALTAVGGVLLVGVALRLLDVRQVKVADLLPGLVVAPLLVWVVMTLG